MGVVAFKMRSPISLRSLSGNALVARYSNLLLGSATSQTPNQPELSEEINPGRLVISLRTKNDWI
jgi:hypothetical protein